MAARRQILIAATALIAIPLQAQDHQHAGKPELLGRVTFATSCRASVAPQFERAVAMLHSFWFGEAYKAFAEVAAADPGCAMAQWGTAMTLLGNPFTGQAPSAESQREALAAAERAVSLAATAMPREQALAKAALALYRDGEKSDYRARLRAHEAAMQLAHERFSADPEVTMFYARAIVANAPASDLTFARQQYAASLLQPLLRTMPNHPGLAHYLIHAYDSPRMASHGLSAARSYADIAPSAPHALHMPSHIFTRLGYWDESIETNTRSAQAEPNPNAAVHAMDYMVYAYLQQGRDAEAKEVVDRAVQNPDRFYGGITGYNFAAMPARYALERGEWADAAKLPVPKGLSPFIEAVRRFSRAVGSTRSGQPSAAREEIAALGVLRDTLRARGEVYWATIVGAQQLAASAWLTRAEGNAAEAVRLAREAAELEETVEKHPVTPGPLLPARELKGDLLLDLGRPAEALSAYEKTLEREPNRARALYGAARAAELAGDTRKAKERYGELARLMAHADVSRPEARAARAFLAKSSS